MKSLTKWEQKGLRKYQDLRSEGVEPIVLGGPEVEETRLLPGCGRLGG